MKSIARRIHHAIAVVSLLALAAMLVSTTLVSEDLENTMLKVELAQEKAFFLDQGHDPLLPVLRQTPSMVLAYVPQPDSPGVANASPVQLPALFQGLGVPFSGEVYRDDNTYLVSIDHVDGGRLYLARNITYFEEREWLFRMALLVASLTIAVLAVVLAVIGARRVVRPLRRLADLIQQMPVETPMARLPMTWQDAELETIAASFNHFVAEFDAYVRREKSLLALASHELRTPIAVMLGALDVLEQRDELSGPDRRTVARLRVAAVEMQTNVQVLLALARKQGDSQSRPLSLSLAGEMRGVLDELSCHYPVNDRVRFSADAAANVVADPALVRMLFRNLVQNALQHTSRRVVVSLQENALEVRDEGAGLDREARRVLQGEHNLGTASGPVAGLGLYLVTLVAERLGWALQIVESSERGTVLRVTFSKPGT